MVDSRIAQIPFGLLLCSLLILERILPSIAMKCPTRYVILSSYEVSLVHGLHIRGVTFRELRIRSILVLKISCELVL